jgi:hypothetical protein
MIFHFVVLMLSNIMAVTSRILTCGYVFNSLRSFVGNYDENNDQWQKIFLDCDGVLWCWFSVGHNEITKQNCKLVMEVWGWSEILYSCMILFLLSTKGTILFLVYWRTNRLYIKLRLERIGIPSSSTENS